MATQTNTNSQGTAKKIGFSIANFKKLFRQSPARKFMSDMEVEQIRVAVEEKNVFLLGKLYDILLQENVVNEEIVRQFVLTKNKIIDDFSIEAVGIQKKTVQAPFQKKVAKAEQEERSSAEDILKNL